ncbi:uncharacterized protein LOC126975923 [Leptidea sinapis]|uniref:uncharacterized protein LOC126975923 n=1 Tax=Leptidea sinapis TaxID=189913 RepID=UPI0021C3F367|nr:uncharacterized protein LOC126975923 [Leptidea sinapis]
MSDFYDILKIEFLSTLSLRITAVISNADTVLVFNLYCNRIKCIRRKLDELKNISCLDQKNSTVKKFLVTYKHLLDIYTPMANVVNFLEGSHFLTLSHYSISIIYNISLVPFLQETILFEYDTIKTILAKEISTCTDKELRVLLFDAVKYITVRPPRHTIWRIIPMDIGLSKTFIEISINYLIVIISFFV